MIKAFKTAEEARESLAAGIQEVYRLLLGTYGPGGTNAVMDDENGNLLLSAQTSSILRNLKSKDLFVDEGIQLAKEAALNTECIAGDGSVLTLIFIREMIYQAKRLIAGGANPVILGRGLKKIIPVIEEKIKEMAEPFTRDGLMRALQYELAEEELAHLIFEAYEKVGKSGTVLVKEGHGLSTELEIREGFEITGGYLSEQLRLEKEKGVTIFYKPYILLTDQTITKFSKLLPLLEQIVAANEALIIVAEDIKEEALTLFLQNINKKIFRAAVIKIPGIGRRKADMLEDLSVYTGGTLFTGNHPLTLETATLSDLGRTSEIRIEKNKILFLGGAGNMEKRMKQIKKIKEHMETGDTEILNKNQYRERIGNLTGKVAVIRVGAPSLLQMHEETHRIQSALAFITAAGAGVLPGGGSALAAISGLLQKELLKSNETEEIRLGEWLVLEALKAPVSALLRKESLGEKEAILRIQNSAGKIGYNVVTHEFTDMIKAGIFDSVTTVVTALNQAASVVYEWLNTQILMVSVSPDREDIALQKQGVPIMRG